MKLTLVKRGLIPFYSGPTTVYSTQAGSEGARHPTVQKFYDLVPPDDQNKYFHGQCAEADVLSQIAYQHNVRCVAQLKKLPLEQPSRLSETMVSHCHFATPVYML
ncbi:hypothetical protein [Pseudomonas sp. W2-17]|uniref:hypothetical protein n=1 Tax=Pseudomonas sp. W2-17 TaxID=3058039 RepID=UPI0034E0D68E